MVLLGDAWWKNNKEPYKYEPSDYSNEETCNVIQQMEYIQVKNLVNMNHVIIEVRRNLFYNSWKCHVCDYSTSQFSTLAIHTQTYMNEKSYSPKEHNYASVLSITTDKAQQMLMVKLINVKLMITMK